MDCFLSCRYQSRGDAENSQISRGYNTRFGEIFGSRSTQRYPSGHRAESTIATRIYLADIHLPRPQSCLVPFLLWVPVACLSDELHIQCTYYVWYCCMYMQFYYSAGIIKKRLAGIGKCCFMQCDVMRHDTLDPFSSFSVLFSFSPDGPSSVLWYPQSR